MTLLDFSKAFDSVHHGLLLAKLCSIGLDDKAVHWFRSYLENRMQKVKWKDTYSTWITTNRGVPQGSVLGPLLFSVYINDITELSKETKFHLYADDVQLYIHETPKNMI